MAWVGFEPMTTDFHSDCLTDWAIMPWVQITLWSNFVQLLQVRRLFSTTFYFGYSPSSVATSLLSEVFCR